MANQTLHSATVNSRGVDKSLAAFGAKRSLIDPRAELIAYLHRRMPRTQLGQIAGLLRPDMLDATQKPEDYRDISAFPEEAFVEFTFEEGFPALPDGRPIWFKLDYEPPALFAAFELYVDLIQSGPRHVAQLLESSELQAMLGDDLNLDYLRDAYHMYYWKDRARAHDQFQEAAYRHIRMRRALSTEDSAYIKASKMLQRVERVFESDDFWKQLEYDPKVALDYFKELLKIKRISAGLPASAPQGEDGGQVSTFEMIMRRVQEETRANSRNENEDSIGTTIDADGRVIPREDTFFRGALGDPQTAKMMQEVIIRMTQQGGATKQPRWAGRVKSSEEEEGNAIPERLPDGLTQDDLPGE